MSIKLEVSSGLVRGDVDEGYGGLFDLVLRAEPTVFSLGYLTPAPWYPFGR